MRLLLPLAPSPAHSAVTSSAPAWPGRGQRPALGSGGACAERKDVEGEELLFCWAVPAGSWSVTLETVRRFCQSLNCNWKQRRCCSAP